MQCAVVGAGAWGTALADLLARGGHAVTLWAREPEVAEAIERRRENVHFLPGALLPASVRVTTDPLAAVRGAALVTYATPSHALRTVARGAAAETARDATLVVATKGIEPETLAFMTAVVEDEVPGRPVAALSGPSFAAEVAAQQPTAVVAASVSARAAELVQRALSGADFRVYTHDDVVGVEVGGALKNVIAVATGIAEGVGLGHNARAALITRGLAEMARLGAALGASPATFAGLAGVGDLVLTCTGALSRNRAVGVEIGRGAGLAEVLAARQTVAEGVTTARGAYALAQRADVEMPIISAVHDVLFAGQPPRDAIAELMGRELRPERDA